MKKTAVIIAGGGFAGLSAAMYLDKNLARRADAEVTLINRENFILFTPMLHEVAAGDLYPGDIVNPLRRILRQLKRKFRRLTFRSGGFDASAALPSSHLSLSSITYSSLSARKQTSSIFPG